MAIVDKSKLSDDWNHPVAIVLDLDQIDQVERDLKKLVKSEKALISITDNILLGSMKRSSPWLNTRILGILVRVLMMYISMPTCLTHANRSYMNLK